MQNSREIDNLFSYLENSIEKNTFIKLSLSKVYKAIPELKNIIVKPVHIKSKTQLSFTYKYKTKDQVQNHQIEEGILVIKNLIGISFFQALLKTTSNEFQLLINKKGRGKLNINKVNHPSTNLLHNKKKNYLISSHNNIYLKELGICDSSGRVKDKQQDKFKQINKYVELMSHFFKKFDRTSEIKIVDMGCGKGYLTFALYDYLKNVLKLNVKVTGVELRSNLVDICTRIKTQCNFDNLNFVSKDIKEFNQTEIDVIIALHACDTATDLAIYKGIISKSKFIVCAPCCHKQVRNDMVNNSEFASLTNFGIFKERQSEMITDVIRALLMEREGYDTKVFEFISNEHTRKNIMLVGVKTEKKKSKLEIEQEIVHLKSSFGVKRQELEDLLLQP